MRAQSLVHSHSLIINALFIAECDDGEARVRRCVGAEGGERGRLSSALDDSSGILKLGEIAYS